MTPEQIDKLRTEAEKLEDEAFLQYQAGQFADAIGKINRVLDIRKQVYAPAKHPKGHPDVAATINNLGMLLRSMGQHEKALAQFEKALAMYEKLYPVEEFKDGHASLSTGLANLGQTYAEMGILDRALEYYQKVLAMRRKLYPRDKFPDGHRQLALSLNNIGVAMSLNGQFDKARVYLTEALEMYRRLFSIEKGPEGQMLIASAIYSLSDLESRQGQYSVARQHSEQALAIFRKLYKPTAMSKGHPYLVTAISSHAMNCHRLGDDAGAAPLFDESLTMARKLFPAGNYPEGHEFLAGTLRNSGVFRHAIGDFPSAIALLRESLEMHHRLLEREIAMSSEAEALRFAESRNVEIGQFLTANNADRRNAGDAYHVIWKHKAILSRILERRHAAARAAGASLSVELGRISAIRREADALLHASGIPFAERDRKLALLADQRDHLERTLVKSLPELAFWKERERLGPEDLIRRMDNDAAFIDFCMYFHFQTDPQKGGSRRWDYVRSYCAFVLVPGKPVQLVELGPAKPIDAAIGKFREDIRNEFSSSASEVLRDLIWTPISRRLPGSTKSVYVSPDGELSRVPFAALAGPKAGSVLLEDFAIAMVAHGPFLLDQMRQSSIRPENGQKLLIGGVNYNRPDNNFNKPFRSLPGTTSELKLIESLSGGNVKLLRGNAATTAAVRQQLASANFAHIATHGFFDEEALAEERQREKVALEQWDRVGSLQSVRVGLGRRNPLAFSGLVFAGANQPTPGDSGILSGERIVEMSLEKLRLCLLSACETGLGDIVGGEGVQGLQRAFHLAGCPNVVASLWKVSDAATAALMAKFYHELWGNKKPPIEALREAQLTIYRHPERIPALAGERGKPDQAKTVELKLEPAAPARAGDANAKSKPTTPTKLWAAFVLSGAGK